MQKRCLKCDELKDVSQFYTDNARKDKIYPWCKSCKKVYLVVRRYKQVRNREKERDARYRRKYKTTWDDLVAKYGEQCNICGVAPLDPRTLHCDHDHVTGLVRGLLCASCNHGLGAFKDDVQVIASAIEYLNR